MFGNVTQPVSSNPSTLSTVLQSAVQTPSATTVAAVPQIQPAGSASSTGPLTFGAFASKPSVSSASVGSNQSTVTAVSFASMSGVTPPSSTQAVSGSFDFPFKAVVTTASAVSSGQNFGKGQSAPFQFGNFPSQPLSVSYTHLTLPTNREV